MLLLLMPPCHDSFILHYCCFDIFRFADMLPLFMPAFMRHARPSRHARQLLDACYSYAVA